MTTQSTPEQLQAEYQRGFLHGYSAGHREGSMTQQQRDDRAVAMQSMVFKRLADKTNGAHQ